MEILRRGVVFVAVLAVLVRSAPRSDSLAAPSGADGLRRSLADGELNDEDPWLRTGRAATPIHLPPPPCPEKCQFRNRAGECVDDWNCIAMMNL